jgi:protein arginine kinase activator
VKCENCGERPAAIHLTQIVDNTVTTVHLCEACAAEKGVHSEASVAKFPLSDFLASLGKEAGSALQTGAEAGSCEFCGSTLRDFRETGRLGCPHCYEQFEPHLRTLLRRIHGSSRHEGEVYLSPEAAHATDRARPNVEALRGQLRRAVDAENFERAAELRDQIRALE